MSQAIFLGFDPGFTTGFCRAVYNPETNTLLVTDMKPIPLNTRHPTIRMENPPIPCFGDFWGRIADVFQDAYEDAVGEPGEGMVVHTAIEDFVGGKGGDIQNTVNKLIGIIMATSFSQDEATFSEPKVYRNKSRIKYLPIVAEKTKGLKDISPHSKDAMAHLLHRVFQECPDQFATIKFEFELTAP